MGSITLQAHGTSTTITLMFRSIAMTTESENENIAIPNESHQFIFLGDKGNTVEAIGDVFSAGDQAIVAGWSGQTLLDVTASDYEEMPVGTYWAVASRKIERKGGYLSRWTYTLKLIECFTGYTTLADGSDL